MTLADYYRALAESGAMIDEAEAAIRRVGRDAPTTSSREEALSAADSLSSTRRRLRALIARQDEADQAHAVMPISERLTDDAVRIGPLSIDPRTRIVQVAGRPLQLAQKEYGLLRALASDPLRVFTKDELLRAVWGFESKTGCRTRTLDSHASRLRRKLGGGFVVNAWGVGYRLVDEIPAGATP